MVPPKLIEDGEVASEKASPDVLKNTIIGGILGLLLVCGIIVVRVILNDTVKSEEDVSKYLVQSGPYGIFSRPGVRVLQRRAPCY